MEVGDESQWTSSHDRVHERHVPFCLRIIITITYFQLIFRPSTGDNGYSWRSNMTMGVCLRESLSRDVTPRVRVFTQSICRTCSFFIFQVYRISGFGSKLFVKWHIFSGLDVRDKVVTFSAKIVLKTWTRNFEKEKKMYIITSAYEIKFLTGPFLSTCFVSGWKIHQTLHRGNHGKSTWTATTPFIHWLRPCNILEKLYTNWIKQFKLGF